MKHLYSYLKQTKMSFFSTKTKNRKANRSCLEVGTGGWEGRYKERV
jgi:hypothetical protein